MVVEHRKMVWCGLLDGEVAQLPLIVKCYSFLKHNRYFIALTVNKQADHLLKKSTCLPSIPCEEIKTAQDTRHCNTVKDI